ncbi:MAG: DUF3006 domain-containing protein [Bacteroidia bacterium]|nr:MAG: DUF3006 domain-containing protein [Bacteroidia bacterium]
MKAVVDKISDGIATVLIEDQDAVLHIPISFLPENLKEGTWLSVNFSVDHQQTQAMYEKNKLMLQQLINKQKKR